MKIYQFIKYNQETKTRHIKHYGNKNLIICFDFEDGIQNSLNESQSATLKEKYRDYFIQVITEFEKNSKIGVRLNANNTNELAKDLLKIKNREIYAIFLPKIENAKELRTIIKKIDSNGIKYQEIIPIIENKIGLENIKDIINVHNIKNVAFGHCDYNLSLNIFPFFHQENNEYWKWVNKILSYTNKKDICFINSPFLSLQHLDFYYAMVQHLKGITNNNFGQVSLSNIHTEVCFNPSIKDPINFKRTLKNRLQFYPSIEFVKETIFNYEKHNNGLGLSKNKESIISYQEYIAAKNYLKTEKQKKVNLTFVGGCFPVQYNILYEDIFLTKIKTSSEKTLNIKLNTSIIRYERLATVLSKIKKLNNTNAINILIFSVRPEPYLRIIKLYYKYINSEGKLKHSLNLPILNIVNPEKFDFLVLSRIYDYRLKNNESSFHKFLINANYLIGKVLGNHSYALNKYIELIKTIEKYCSNNNIKLLLLGPNLRSNVKIEPYFCKSLETKTKKIVSKNQYVYGLDTVHNKKELFHENGIHVNEIYHEMIAKRIIAILKNYKNDIDYI